MEQRISLVTLGSGDLARPRRFYEEGLGRRTAASGSDRAMARSQEGIDDRS